MDELGGLLLDRRDDLRVAWPVELTAMPGREVEEQVAVDVLDGQAIAADRHERVGARQARRGPGLVELDVGARLGAGDLGDDVRDRPSPAIATRPTTSCTSG